MLYLLLYPLYSKFSVFNVFRYITFRTVLAVLSALIISFVLTPYMIRKFHEWKIRSEKREDVPERHEEKRGTPTMGGFVILVSTIVPTLLWSDLRNSYTWIVTFALVAFGAIGFMDDFKKLRHPHGKGIPGKMKLSLQAIFAIIIGLLICMKADFRAELTVPFFKISVLTLASSTFFWPSS
jgi:phospho-N-acetylmuramoyl-pentapeptide-transferase